MCMAGKTRSFFRTPGWYLCLSHGLNPRQNRKVRYGTMRCFFPPNSFFQLLPLFGYFFGLCLGVLFTMTHWLSLKACYVLGLGPGAAGSALLELINGWGGQGINDYYSNNMHKKKLQTEIRVVPGYIYKIVICLSSTFEQTWHYICTKFKNIFYILKSIYILKISLDYTYLLW